MSNTVSIFLITSSRDKVASLHLAHSMFLSIQSLTFSLPLQFFSGGRHCILVLHSDIHQINQKMKIFLETEKCCFILLRDREMSLYPFLNSDNEDDIIASQVGWPEA